ncbi:MAG: hypothetical protein KH354_05330 [Clostridiales bacterium]|nr:hypothetical protein [Clostridiales bacterium]
MAEETVGAIWLELGLKDDGISAKVKNAVDEAKKAAEKPAQEIGETIREKVSRSLRDVDAGKPFELAQDALGLLNQKLDNTYSKIGALQEKHKELTALYDQKVIGFKSDTEEAKKLDAQLNSVEEQLISLQGTANQTEAKIKKVIESAEQTGEKAQSNTVKSAKKTATQTVKSAKSAAGAVKKEYDLINASMSKGADTAGKRGKRSMNGLQKGARGLALGVKRAFKATFLMAGLYAAFRGIKTIIGDAVKGNKQFAQSLNLIKGNLKVAFTPIINAVIPVLNRLAATFAAVTKAVATAIAGLFGQTYEQALAATKKLEQTTAAAKKASATIGIDELNVIGKDEGATDLSALDNAKYAEEAMQKVENFKAKLSGFGVWVEQNVFSPIRENLSKFSAPFAKLQGLFKGVSDGFKKNMKPLGDWFKNDLPKAISSGVGAVSTVLAGLLDMLGSIGGGVMRALQPAIDWMSTDGLPMLSDVFCEISKTAESMFASVKSVFDRLWTDAVEPVLGWIGDAVTDLLTDAKARWDEYGAPIFESAREALENAENIFESLWNNTLKPIFDEMYKAVTDLWETSLRPLLNKLGEFKDKLVQTALTIYNKAIAPIVQWVVDYLYPKIVPVIQNIVRSVKSMIRPIVDAVGNIFDALGGLLDFITGVFSGNWEKAWTGIKDFVKGIFDGLINVLKVPINWIISLINNVIRGINGTIDLINGIPGVNIGHIGEIPALASGGIVSAPTLAMVGEYGGASSNPEVIAPLDKLQAMLQNSGASERTYAQLLRIIALLEALLVKDPELAVYLDSREVSRALRQSDSRAGIALADGVF